MPVEKTETIVLTDKTRINIEIGKLVFYAIGLITVLGTGISTYNDFVRRLERMQDSVAAYQKNFELQLQKEQEKNALEFRLLNARIDQLEKSLK